jgi:hypothetical protein
MKFKKKINNLKIIWLGPYVSPKYLNLWKAVSPAANKWQYYLLKSLIQIGQDIEFLFYRPESYWPKGKFLPSKIKYPIDILKNKQETFYINSPFLRNLTMTNTLKKKLYKIIQNNNSQTLIVISYNETEWTKKIFTDKVIKANFLRIYIVADDAIPKDADAYVFLSYGVFKKKKYYNKLFLDGAPYHLDSKFNTKKIFNRKKIFLYSGSLYKYTGIRLVFEALEYIKDKNFEVWICGPGYNKMLGLALKKDKRIKFFGLVSEKRFNNICRKVDVFLNPRANNTKSSEISFPSKLFDYILWNKPIISTWTKSLSPMYKKILHIVDHDAFSIALAMTSYLDEKNNFKSNNKEIMKKKGWIDQARRLVFFIKRIIKNKPQYLDDCKKKI